LSERPSPATRHIFRYEGLHAIAMPLADNWLMAKVRWAVPCTAHRKSGQPCSAWSITGGYVCWTHGGAIRRVREAAQRRWQHELIFREIERKIERETGQPLDPVWMMFIRYAASGDIATWRRHRRTREPESA